MVLVLRHSIGDRSSSPVTLRDFKFGQNSKNINGAFKFSRSSCQLPSFASSFVWFSGLSMSFVIGQSEGLSFGFTNNFTTTYMEQFSI